MSLRTVGCHGFAGGFTQGVMRRADVACHLETLTLGKETVEQKLGIPFHRYDDPDRWLDHRDEWQGADFLFGNPRCTAFSNLTSGYGGKSHGPYADATCDARQFVAFAARVMRPPVFCWESVQNALTTGDALIKEMVELCANEGYRVAHVLVNAATFGNAQHRKRYFFIGYENTLTFNVEPPDIVSEHATVHDIIGAGTELWDKAHHWREDPIANPKFTDYEDFSCLKLDPETAMMIPDLGPKESINTIHRRRPKRFKEIGANRLYKRSVLAASDTPFSLHCPVRLAWSYCCPTIAGSAYSMIHPELNRALTVAEIAALMGWDVTPVGPNPVGQIGKGIVPDIGEWITRQVELCLDDAWGSDWGSSYDNNNGEWVGCDTTNSHEKTFDLTRYAPMRPNWVRPTYGGDEE